MKKFSVKRLLAVCLALALALGALGITALAGNQNPTVMYNGSTGKVEFENALLPFFPSSDAPDLFTDLKGMMPGDSVTQTITVGTKNTGMDTVKLYLRTENENAHYQKLMSTDYADWITFTVKQDGKVLAEGNLKNGVLLGTFNTSKKTELEVTLAIGIEAGNDLQGLAASVDWVFTAEVLPYLYPVTPDEKIPAAKLDWLNAVDHVNYIMGYPDGTVWPDGDITRAEVAAIFFRLMTDEARSEFWSTQNSYSDVQGRDWFNVAVSTLTKAGILEGYEDGTFRPNMPITRAELATMISRFDLTFGTFETTASFPDSIGHWAEAYINHSAARGWVVGYPDGTFRPDRNITRAETVTMINRALQRTVDERGLLAEYVDWTDNYSNSWYYFDMLEAGNYHTYQYSGREIEGQTYSYENWTGLLGRIDWDMMEHEWVQIYG